VLSGCAEATTTAPPACSTLPLAVVEPADTTLEVGGTVTLRYKEGAFCFLDGRTAAHLEEVPTRWFTIDTFIVRVDSLSGRVTALRRGDAFVFARAEREARIQVR
jgi:hypothetical protein